MFFVFGSEAQKFDETLVYSSFQFELGQRQSIRATQGDSVDEPAVAILIHLATLPGR
jgi:hypothetical protein